MKSLSGIVSSGLPGFDEVIDSLRLGDNVVWQTDSIEDYKIFTDAFVKKSLDENRKVIYIRFGKHQPVIYDTSRIKTHNLSADMGFESFATQIYKIITDEGRYAFYVFDCLTELLEEWCSDLMLGNFFRITCPYLYILDTVAYFCILRNRHSFSSIARIRETTQLLIDIKNVSPDIYVHPLKVWERYSPTMFLPHKFVNNKFKTITSSVDASFLSDSSSVKGFTGGQIDYWDKLFIKAESLLDLPAGSPERVEIFDKLVRILIGREPEIVSLAKEFFFLEDIIKIKNRQIGTGYIGGKSVGMLLARNILIRDEIYDFSSKFESHDSFYLGSDIFYTYLVQNGWWSLRMEQITPEGYFSKAKELKEKLLSGTFPAAIKERFVEMLEYFGQSPIIVRSSSLLEDNFGNAFAGKYESIFCVNQGSPEQRYTEFENAVKKVFASTMNEDALNYRLRRNLSGKDEQMAILVQRVSGDYHGQYFYPALAGVGNSSNIYVWDKQIDAGSGMLRLVYGLGTRAVDRVSEDYPRIVSLDKPTLWPVDPDKKSRYSQHFVDLLDLKENILKSIDFSELVSLVPENNISLFAERDNETYSRMREFGRVKNIPYILTFKQLFSSSSFSEYMQNMLKSLHVKYNYPVDIEFTANFNDEGKFFVNLLQCRPLQTKGFGPAIPMPENISTDELLFSITNDFMGGNVRIDIHYAIYIDPLKYSNFSDSEKHELARLVGKINQNIDKEKSIVMLISPGRLGTTTPSLGLPVSFSEISNMSVLCELEYKTANLMPELSYGSHFFQEMVESDIFYAAIFPDKNGNVLNLQKIEIAIDVQDYFSEICKNTRPEISNSIKLIKGNKLPVPALRLYSDIVSQKCICTFL